METASAPRSTLLLVDDEPANLQLLRHVLQADYRLLFATDGEAALALARDKRPDLIVLDVMMPGLSGHEVCAALKQDPTTRAIPVLFATALAAEEDEARGLELGAVDYLTKPISPPIVRARVRIHLSLVQAEELRRTRLQIIQCLGAAAEYRDNETGKHILRMSRYARVLARAAGYDEAAAEELFHAAPMHDVGKIGIPDAVLLKPGKLDAEEWKIMRQHPAIGARIIGQHDSPLLRLAATIARHHHEKWDGSGYPDGLAGETIPLPVRIVSLADVFDALTSVRPYKPAWPVEQALDFVREQRGRHFDPRLVDLFLDRMPEILAIKERYAD